MRQVGVVIVLLPLMMLFGSGCVSEPGIDKEKFSELKRTSQELKAFIKSDKPCDVPDALLQRLASGTAALKDKASSKAESDVIAACSQLLTTYKDGLLLCQHRNQLSEFQFVPNGRIYVSQELDPLVERYGLPIEKHQYKPTGSYLKSISGDSISVIWHSAEAEIKNIETMEKYN